MSWFSVFAIYFLIWWLTFFAVLPIGVRTPDEDGSEIPLGTTESAPVRPMMGRKVMLTTAISGVLFGLLWFGVSVGVLSLDTIPFLPKF